MWSSPRAAITSQAQHVPMAADIGVWWKAPVSSETVSFLVSLLVPGLWVLLGLGGEADHCRPAWPRAGTQPSGNLDTSPSLGAAHLPPLLPGSFPPHLGWAQCQRLWCGNEMRQQQCQHLLLGGHLPRYSASNLFRGLPLPRSPLTASYHQHSITGPPPPAQSI